MCSANSVEDDYCLQSAAYLNGEPVSSSASNGVEDLEVIWEHC